MTTREISATREQKRPTCTNTEAAQKSHSAEEKYAARKRRCILFFKSSGVVRKLILISIRWQIVDKVNLELIFVIFWVRSACEIRANKTKRIGVLDVDNHYVLSQLLISAVHGLMAE